MASTQLVCPHCGSSVNFNQAIAPGAVVECLICMKSFAAEPSAAPRPKLSPTKPAAVGAAKSSAKASTRPADQSRPNLEPDPAQQGGAGAMIAIALVLLLLVGGGVGFAVWKVIDSARNNQREEPTPQFASNGKSKDEPKKTPTIDADGKKSEPDKSKKEVTSPVVPEKTKGEDGDAEEIGKKPKQEDKGLKRKEEKKVEEKDPEEIPIKKVAPPIEKLVKPIPGIDAPMLNGAVDKGVAFLKRTQHDDGSWAVQSFHVGYASFAGLTLLECKVPADDLAVKRAATYVRANAQNAIEGYEISTAILFLDRLGDPKDRPLIQHLAIRLLCGQNEDACWGYRPPRLDPADGEALLKFLQSRKQPNGKAVSDKGEIRADSLSAYMQSRMVVKNQGRAKGAHDVKGPNLGTPSDHSNTQFALLALWAARRHEVPTDHAILAAYQRFAILQSRTDGGWAYTASDIPGAAPNAFPSTNTMTCVGLLALALGHGVAPEYHLDPKTKEKVVTPATKDPRIDFALRGLSRWVGNPVAAASFKSQKIENFYFLWSVERVGVLYELDKINGQEWYGWGAQILVANQGLDGAWAVSGDLTKAYPGQDATVNTCFALLFLKRSNLVADLTTNLKLHSGIREP